MALSHFSLNLHHWKGFMYSRKQLCQYLIIHKMFRNHQSSQLNISYVFFSFRNIGIPRRICPRYDYLSYSPQRYAASSWMARCGIWSVYSSAGATGVLNMYRMQSSIECIAALISTILSCSASAVAVRSSSFDRYRFSNKTPWEPTEWLSLSWMQWTLAYYPTWSLL